MWSLLECAVTEETRHREIKHPPGSEGEVMGEAAPGVGCPGVAGLLAGRPHSQGSLCDPRLA